MSSSRRFCLAVGLAVSMAVAQGGVALADITDSTGTNIEQGDNEASADQGGSSGSGDAVGGQVAGIVSAGDTSVDAKNRSEDADVESGESHGSNSTSGFVGLNDSSTATVAATTSDVSGCETDDGVCRNLQDGDNELDVTQVVTASSGDAVGGQVVGAVTAAGGSTEVVADNASEDVDVLTGDADADNATAAFVGLSGPSAESAPLTVTADVSDCTSTAIDGCANLQDGDNAAVFDQAADAATGDGVAGQVIGVVSAGDTSVDARNGSEDVDLETGGAQAANGASALVGLSGPAQSDSPVTISDVSGCVTDTGGGDSCNNLQDGDNDGTFDQSAAAASGDAVGGEVIGAVTAAGGSADIVADNASEDVDIETGLGVAVNEAAALVGLTGPADFRSSVTIVADVSGCSAPGGDGCSNLQDGDNTLDVRQSADGASGDGVGGQVVGVVSAGDASVDARNRSEDVDLETGGADAGNAASALVGLSAPADGQSPVAISDVTGCIAPETEACGNLQDGDNEASFDQSARASSGDAVGGEVIGAVTAAGGSADIVADNASQDVDIETGLASAANDAAAFVGLTSPADSRSTVTVVADVSDCVAINESEGSSDTCGNLQDGDNTLGVDQTADAATGDGVGGQVIGAVSAGDTSIDARNRSEDVDLESGGADATNDASALVGLSAPRDSTSPVVVSDVSDCASSGPDACVNLQDGDNDAAIDQSATATSGDGVGGQVIGAVTAAGGSADIVADNASEDVDIETGAATGANDAAAFVGLFGATDSDSSLTVTADVSGCLALSIDMCGNLQDGDNTLGVDQTADAATGDGVGGQVIGAVSAGDTSIDARNRSEDVDVQTGVADALNDASAVVGLSGPFDSRSTVTVSDVSGCETTGNPDTCSNLQDGDNDGSIDQSANAASGDGVGGQVIGAVTASGGSADIVADNASEDVGIETGAATGANDAAAFVGLFAPADSDSGLIVTADVSDCGDATDACGNLQDGDNELTLAQTSDASTGDGVGGQVIGAVSAGDTSIDARNRSEDVGIDTGTADASNDAAVVVGLAASLDRESPHVVQADVSDCAANFDGCGNLQDGDNEASIDQTAAAASGDGVGGQVIGAVTSAGGSADIVADNASEDVDVESGEASADNEAAAFVGLSYAADGDTDLVVEADVTGCDATEDDSCGNLQDGDNTLDLSQSADAASGDGVGGQVLGVVSAGAASVDARNRSEDVDVESGPADASNAAAAVVGLRAGIVGSATFVGASDVADCEANGTNSCFNLQDGDNDGALTQSAAASSGDAVAGQVAGVVTSAGGSAEAVLDNVSADIDAESGTTDFFNDDSIFVGLAFNEDELVVG